MEERRDAGREDKMLFDNRRALGVNVVMMRKRGTSGAEKGAAGTNVTVWSESVSQAILANNPDEQIFRSCGCVHGERVLI